MSTSSPLTSAAASEELVDRRDYLNLVTENVLETHTAWVEDRGPFDTFAEGCEELIEVFGAGTIPGGCRALAEAVDELRPHWQRFKTEAGEQLEGSILPDNGFWRAFEHIEAVQAARKTPAAPPPEPIEDLIAQKVSERQICMIYKWVDEFENPLFEKLREERANPGTHTGAGFVHPAEQARIDAEKKRQEIEDRIRERRAWKIEQASKPGPESVTKIVQDGISGEQASKMLRCSVEDFYAQCDALGLERPPLRYDSLTGRGELERPLTEGEEAALAAEQKQPTRGARSMQQREEEDIVPPAPQQARDAVEQEPFTTAPMTLEQQIVALHQTGDRKPKAIAMELSQIGPVPVSIQKVNAVLKRFKEDPEAFDAPEV